VENLHLSAVVVVALRVKKFSSNCMQQFPKCLNILGTLPTASNQKKKQKTNNNKNSPPGGVNISFEMDL